MKIGINNIFTTFWFFIMILCGASLTYISFEKKLFTSDLIFIAKFFIGLMILISIGILFYLFYKFRLLFIDSKSVVSIHPFLFKKVKIDLTNIKILELENWTGQKGTVYRKVSLADSNSNLNFTDREF